MADGRVVVVVAVFGIWPVMPFPGPERKREVFFLLNLRLRMHGGLVYTVHDADTG